MTMRGKFHDWRAARKAARKDRENKEIWAGLTSQTSDLSGEQSAREDRQRQIAEEQERRTITGLGL
jgi:hypothetical protein